MERGSLWSGREARQWPEIELQRWPRSEAFAVLHHIYALILYCFGVFEREALGGWSGYEKTRPHRMLLLLLLSTYHAQDPKDTHGVFPGGAFAGVIQFS